MCGIDRQRRFGHPWQFAGISLCLEPGVLYERVPLHRLRYDRCRRRWKQKIRKEDHRDGQHHGENYAFLHLWAGSFKFWFRSCGIRYGIGAEPPERVAPRNPANRQPDSTTWTVSFDRDTCVL